ncbi:Uncharacterized protein ACMD2_08246 [Ananas comosus]|uniref:Nucleotide-diphospho-sugar transferase domain-containing protein n=1 Tax=Ananas comosus TaxID=4615 RepID=A0A199V707_ANACO|nr:Uncharacterized protein ACMD2_08246 [Ananas comosus]
MMSNTKNLQPVISFLVGASLATAFILFILSARKGNNIGTLMASIEEITTTTTTTTTNDKLTPPFEENETKMVSNGEINTTKITSGTPPQENETKVVSIEETTTPSENETKMLLAPIAQLNSYMFQLQENNQDLLKLLQRAATEDRTVIITSVNKAWAAPNSLLDLFLESFRIGDNIEHLLNHLIVVTLDKKAFKRCKAVHSHCYFLYVEGAKFDEEKVYMSKDYLDLVWSKVKLQQHILELGYNFLFTDVDIVWLRNPFEKMSAAAHISTSCDFYFGDPNSPINFPNTGFLFVKSYKENIELFEYWHESREKFPGNHEQFVFNQIKFELADRFRVNIQYLDPANFGGFCNHTKGLDTIYTMHANCCVGLQAKLHDLRSVLDDWKVYKALTTDEEKRRGQFTWRAGICLH